MLFASLWRHQEQLTRSNQWLCILRLLNTSYNVACLFLSCIQKLAISKHIFYKRINNRPIVQSVEIMYVETKDHNEQNSSDQCDKILKTVILSVSAVDFTSSERLFPTPRLFTETISHLLSKLFRFSQRGPDLALSLAHVSTL